MNIGGISSGGSTSAAGGSSSGNVQIGGGASGNNASAQASQKSSGMGSGYAWIGDIVKAVGSFGEKVLGYDLANRQYKYDLMNPLPVKSNQTTITIVLVASAILIISILVIFAIKSPNQTQNAS